jgi:hypothetical protein
MLCITPTHKPPYPELSYNSLLKRTLFLNFTQNKLTLKMSSSQVVLSVAEWNPTAIKYTAPKLNKQGGKAINIISTQRNRALHISTPLMMTWGISDFVNESTGESDGKYSMTLNFPNTEYANATTNSFLQKFKDFENQILDDAVKNSELWWGEEMSREVAKHSFYPLLKYSKIKDTKRIDYSKPPSIRGKVPFYDGKWGIEIYNTKNDLIFPCEDSRLTPVEFVPKLSNVACVLQCGGIWIGGKGWGLTWKVVQCVVKPKEVVTIYGKCQIQLSSEERETIDAQQIKEDDFEDEPVLADVTASQINAPSITTTSTFVADSDHEDEPAPAPAVTPVTKKVVKKAPEPAPIVEQAPTPAPEVEQPVEPPTPPPVVEETTAPAPAKTVVKKVVKKVVGK